MQLLLAIIAQGTEAIATGSPVSILLGILATSVATMMTWIMKEQNKKMDNMTGAIGGLSREIRDQNKVGMALAHRQKGLESAIQMEVLTRPGVPPFLRDQIVEKLRKRSKSEDTRDEQGRD